MAAHLTLVLGGARSGKSALSEKISCETGSCVIYLATAEALDDEMRAKIEKHREQRGDEMETIEAPLDLPEALGNARPDATVLIDCLTMWLSNLMLADRDVGKATDALLAALAARTAPVICVSNETGLGIVPDTPLGRRFRDAQGTLNQRVAAQADRVLFVAAGLPLALKGAPL